MVLSAKGGVRPGTDRSKSLTYSVTDVLLLAVDEAEDLLRLAADKDNDRAGDCRESGESAAEEVVPEIADVVAVTDEDAEEATAAAAESATEGNEDWHRGGTGELVGDEEELDDDTAKLEVWRLRLRLC